MYILFSIIKYIIHNHAAQFNLNFIDYGIRRIKTTVQSSKMNALSQRFVGSVRRDVPDYYVLINEKQIMQI
jgi:hypothetical protein